jgi:uncharacterized integral membrane protein
MATPPERRGRGPGFAAAFLALILISVALISLVWQNQEAVPLEWLWVSTEVPLFVIVLVTALIAILADELVGLVWRARRRRRLAEKEELKRLRAEVSSPPADEEPDPDA